MIQDGVRSLKVGLTRQRDQESGRAVRDSIAEEAGRSDADNAVGLCLNKNRGSDERGIGGKLRLPCTVADHRCRGSRGSVVAFTQRASGISAQSQRGEVVA